MVKILHISDSHGFALGMQDIVAFSKAYPVDMFVHTGDICQDAFEDDITYAAPQNYALTLGNHDMILRQGIDPSGNHWEQQPTQEQAYDKFFKNYYAANNLSIQAGKTWWYRDIGNVRVLGLNSCTMGAALTEQAAWLNTILEECMRGGKSVVVFSHYPDIRDTVYPCSFTCEKYYSKNGITGASDALYGGVAMFFDTVQAYYTRGLKVLGWFCGHEHADAIVTSHGFPVVIIGSMRIDDYNDLYRATTGHTVRTIANLYEFDEELNVLQIFRIGADCKYSGAGRRLMLSYDLSERRVVAQCSAY